MLRSQNFRPLVLLLSAVPLVALAGTVDTEKYQGVFLSQCAQVDDIRYTSNNSSVNLREFFEFRPIVGSSEQLNVSVRQEIFAQSDSTCSGSSIVTVNGNAIFSFIDESAIALPDFQVMVPAARVNIDFDGWEIDGEATYNSSNDTYRFNGVMFRASNLNGGHFKQLVHTDSFFRFGDDDDFSEKDDQDFPTALRNFSDIDVLARTPFLNGFIPSQDIVDHYVGDFVGECELTVDAYYNGQPVYVREMFTFEKVDSTTLSAVLKSYYFPGVFRFASCPIGLHALELKSEEFTVEFTEDILQRELPGFGLDIHADGVMVNFNGFSDVPDADGQAFIAINGFEFPVDFFQPDIFKSVFFANDHYWLMGDDEITDAQGYGIAMTDILRRVGDNGLIELGLNAYDYAGQYMSCSSSNEIFHQGEPVILRENLNLVPLDASTLSASLLYTIYDSNEQNEWCDNYGVEPLLQISSTGATIHFEGITEVFVNHIGSFDFANKVTINSDGFDGFWYLRDSEVEFVDFEGLHFSIDLLTEFGQFKDILYLDNSIFFEKRLNWGNEYDLDDLGYPVSLNESKPMFSVNDWNESYVIAHLVSAVSIGLDGGLVEPEFRFVFDGLSSGFIAYSEVEGIELETINGCGGYITVQRGGITNYWFDTVTESCTVTANFVESLVQRKRRGLPVWLPAIVN